jgi:hypothetical protein
MTFMTNSRDPPKVTLSDSYTAASLIVNPNIHLSTVKHNFCMAWDAFVSHSFVFKSSDWHRLPGFKSQSRHLLVVTLKKWLSLSVN